MAHVKPSLQEGQEPGFLLSLEEQQGADQDQEGISFLTAEEEVPTYSTEQVLDLAREADFALGEDSPGPLVLEEKYESGNEQEVRALASSVAQDNTRQAQDALVSQFLDSRQSPTEPLSEEEGVTLESLSSRLPAVDTRVALEELFSERYVTTSLSQAAQDNPAVSEAVDEDPVQAGRIIDMAIEDLTTVNIIHAEIQRLNSREDGFFSAVSDFLEILLIPGKQTIDTYLLNEDLPDLDIPDTFFLGGNNLLEKFQFFYSLPHEAQAEILPRISDALTERNSLTAANFLARLLSFPESDQRFENLISGIDVVDLTSTTAAVATLGKLGILFKTAQSILRGSIRKPRGVTSALDAVGDVYQSAFIKARNKVKRAAAQQPETDNLKEIFELVPSLFNPRVVLSGTKESYSALESARLLTLLQKNSVELFGGLNDTLAVRRMLSENPDDLILAVRQQFGNEYNRLVDKVIDVRLGTEPSKTLTDNQVYEVLLGDLNREPFVSQRVAEATAKKIYKLNKNDYHIESSGPRFQIVMKTVADESGPFVRSLKLTTDEVTPQTSSFLRETLRRYQTPEASFSKAGSEDRRVAVLGSTRLTSIVRGIDEVFQSLPSKGRKRLSSFLNKERTHINADGDQGRFAENIGEFQDAWRKEFDDVAPTVKEAAAYFSFRQLSDLDWTIRNFDSLGGKLQRNIKDNVVPLAAGKTAEFEGAASSFTEIRPEAGVMIVKGNGQHTFIRANTLENRDTIEALIKKKGYQVTHTSPKGQASLNEVEVLKKVSGTATVNFILSKSIKRNRLGVKQLEYTPGGHRIHDEGAFVSMPEIHTSRDPATGNIISQNYKGDNTLLWFRSKAETRKYTPLLNKAKVILKEGRDKLGKLTPGGEARLKDYLDSNLPSLWTVNKFKNLFRETGNGPFSINHDFYSADYGLRTADSNKLSEVYPMFLDESQSSLNLYANLNKRFHPERNDPLLTIRERDDTLRFDTAPVLDAFPALESGLNSLISNKFLDSLKFNAATRFVKEFGHLLRPDVDVMVKNPLPYLFNPPYRSGATPAQLKVADNYVRSTKELLNVDNKTNQVLRRMQMNMADSIYLKSGQETLDNLGPYALGAIKEPTAFLRASAFHMTLGLFNPVQLFVQGTTFVHIAALGGTRNALASAPAAWMMQFARNTTNPKVLEGMAEKAAAYGWKKKHWLEANQALRRSGFDVLGRDQSLLDDAFNPQFITTKFGRSLDTAAMFFNGIERAIRHGAYTTSYRKWRKSLPKAKFDDAAERVVLADAQRLTVDMLASANASWQRGWASIPTQFWSYSTRMMEQFLSKRITWKERSRLMAFYGAAFGLPASIAIGTTIPASEMVRDKLNKEGIQVDDTVYEGFRDGLLATFVEALTGTDFDISGRLSPEGQGPAQFLVDVFKGDKDTFELLMGIGGGKIGQTILAGFAPFKRMLLTVGEDTVDQPFITPEEARTFMSNISSFNQMEKFLFALNYDAYYTRSGRKIAFTTRAEGTLTSLMGFNPDFISQIYSLRRITKSQIAFKRKIAEQIKKEFRFMIRSVETGDDTAAYKSLRAVSAWMQGGQFNDDERAELYVAAEKDNLTMYDTVSEKFLKAFKDNNLNRALLIQNTREKRVKELEGQR